MMFDFQRQRRRPLHTARRRFVLKEMEGASTLFDLHEVTYLDGEQGAVSIEEASFYQAGCGHLVGLVGPGELIANCGLCGRSLCMRCGNLRCRRCLVLLCTDCTRLVDETVGYCQQCKRIVLVKRLISKAGHNVHRLLSMDIQK